MKTRSLTILTTALIATFFSACASGPKYKNSVAALNPKPGKGLVLAYWTSGVFGAAAEYHVYANGQELGHGLGRGQFLSYEAEPGPLSLTTRGKMNAATALGTAITALPTAGLSVAAAVAHVAIKHKTPDVNVGAGQTHFMRLSTGTFSTKFKEEPGEKAEREIANCRWVNVPRN